MRVWRPLAKRSNLIDATNRQSTEFKPKFAKIRGYFEGLQQNSLVRNCQFSTISNRRSSSVTVQSLKKIWYRNFENSSPEFGRPKKAENLGKKFAKNSGRAPAWPFSELKLSLDPASHVTKIVPLTHLGAEKLGVKVLTLTKNFWKREAPPPANFTSLESSHRDLQAQPFWCF